ncbi:DUF2957 domain-containing protein [Burkholderia glumae]|uniref:DUF2957 domain-containing protein n=1 Tax=Burkholderia glumae TaxID=337 RepID=A0AAQ0BRJ6_BURGL|nr:DUF2957 domain-containing protein [Burkholderia glumae]ACR31176.1 Hypothetical protein bglu_2g07580 [Burkholderia glumae BGR1]AJY64743.1 hypothetical protein KS03_5153 [Burkholderia glumae LMG 2196 = ATCC 33617]KHJ60376.1 hypothetical protein NCPPB3923_24455 [Burkholderia glumae]MCM2483484.1 DUF2957 domain-containing protein [Burkholderia glumae]MCM2493833.1 DUF2957 domain-containing protein [Burkholderia glumae]
MFRNTKPRTALLSCFVLAMPFFAGCGGGDSGDAPAAIQVPQCSGSSCPASGSTTTATVTNKLCPDALDYSTTYTGGSGSGEYVKVQFDTTKLTYQMQFVLSSVPTSAGQVNLTRAGKTITGTFHRATSLPTAEQNRCAFVLDNGATSDGSYSVTINPVDPPTLFVGNGVVGGGIPGATIEFDGVALLGNLGAVPSRTFDFFPYIGFTDTETDFTKVAGNYNELGIHLSPIGTSYQTAKPQGWQPDVVNWNETLNADGSCTITPGSDYSCRTTGSPWTLRTNSDGSPDNVFVSKPTSSSSPYPSAGQGQPIVLLAPSQAQGIMIVGKLRGALIPIVIRVGQAFVPSNPADLLSTVADAEIGISALAPATAIASNSLTGGFIGATSASACGIVANNGNSAAPAVGDASFNASVPHPNLPGIYSGTFFEPTAGNCLDGTAVSTFAANYTSTLFSGATAAFIDPLTSSSSSTFSLDYTQATPGLIKVTALQDFNARNGSGPVAIFHSGDTGWAIKVGEVYAMVMNNSQYNPFFTVGAFVQ